MIKKLMMITVIVSSLVVLGMAQARQDQSTPRTFNFDTTHPVTLEGKILAVTEGTTGTGRYGKGIHLTLSTSQPGKNARVILGPASYLQAQNWDLKVGDTIAIKAFNGTGNNSGNYFASTLTRAGKLLQLRDDRGLPSWRRSLTNQKPGANLGQGRGYGRGHGKGFGNGQGRGAGRCGRCFR